MTRALRPAARDPAIESDADPLASLGRALEAHGWPVAQEGADAALICDVVGRWCDYRLEFRYDAEAEALTGQCRFALKGPGGRRPQLAELLLLANQQLWLGHFGLDPVDENPVFRLGVPLRGVGTLSAEQADALVGAALEACERYYPALQFVLWGGKSPAEALAAAILEPQGMA